MMHLGKRVCFHRLLLLPPFCHHLHPYHRLQWQHLRRRELCPASNSLTTPRWPAPSTSARLKSLHLLQHSVSTRRSTSPSIFILIVRLAQPVSPGISTAKRSHTMNLRSLPTLTGLFTSMKSTRRREQAPYTFTGQVQLHVPTNCWPRRLISA